MYSMCMYLLQPKTISYLNNTAYAVGYTLTKRYGMPKMLSNRNNVNCFDPAEYK